MTDGNASGTDEFEKLARDCLATTGDLLELHRYRLAGSPECLEAAHSIAEQFRACCDSVQEEPFVLHPRIMWFLGRAIAVCYALGTAAVLLGGWFLYAGTLLCLAGLAYGLSQFVFYSQLFDPLFASAEGRNVTGFLEPSGDVRRQVLLVAHHDSAFVFSFLEHWQSAASIRLLIAVAFYFWLCGFAVVASLIQLLSGHAQIATGAPLWITIVGLPFVSQLFFMLLSEPTPGAADNLNSVSMGSTLAGYFGAEAQAGRPLTHTKLVLVSTDGEELGQRGAIEYARRHGGELRATPTFVLNIDTISHEDDLAVLTRDRNSTRALSGAMASEIRAIADEQGIGLQKKPLRVGGGGTDAAAFAVAGIEATSLIGMATGIFSSGHTYHTSKDTVEYIEPGAVRATLKLAAAYIRRVDGAP